MATKVKPLKPTEGILTPRVVELVQDILSEVGRSDSNSPEDYLEMCTSSPVLSPALDVVNLLAISMLGEYQHQEESITEWVRMNLENMRGSLALAFSELVSAKPLGNSVSEWGVTKLESEWRLLAIQALDPKYYSFEGRKGAIESIIYRGANEEIKIPYDRVIHVVNQRHLSFGNPYGVAECKRAYAAWQAWKIVVSCMLVAAKRNAVPIIAGYSDSEVLVPLLDANGDPLKDSDGELIQVPAPRAMLEQLQELENNSVISTDINNRIEAIRQESGGQFFFEALRYLGQLQLMAFLVPETILTATGVGDSNLNRGQRSTLTQSVESLVNQIKEEILEKCIRQLITWQFGENVKGGWGSFPVPEEEMIDRTALLQVLNQAIVSGVFPVTDLQVINRARDLAGIPPIEQIAQGVGDRMSLSYWASPNGVNS